MCAFNPASISRGMMDLAVLNVEMTAGIYKKPIEEIAKTFSYAPVPGEASMENEGGVVSTPHCCRTGFLNQAEWEPPSYRTSLF